MTLDERKQDAVEELKGWILDNPDNDEPHDFIFETADDWVPVYNSDILQLGSDNWELMTTEPEIGPAFDGSPTPINIIAANIFEAITGALWEFWNEYEDLDEEEKEDFIQELKEEAA